MKQLKVKVIANAKKNEVVADDNTFKVYVNAPPIDGKANKAVVEVIAKYFSVKKNSVKIIRGEKSKEKVIQINQD